LFFDAATSEELGAFLLPDARISRVIESVIEAGRSARRIGRDVRTNPLRLARKVVPARRFMSATYGVSEFDRRLPLYYLHRLLSLRWLRNPYRG
jgi:hypothetical protein